MAPTRANSPTGRDTLQLAGDLGSPILAPLHAGYSGGTECQPLRGGRAVNDPIAVRSRGAAQAMSDDLIALTRRLIAAPSENPPGDTRKASKVVCDFLDAAGLDYHVVSPNPTMPNLVATFAGGEPGRHLVLNGHLDTFPVGPRERWSTDPFGGELRDGRIFGRGAADMKAGLSSLLIAFSVLSRERAGLKGRVTLTVVSDEETFGPWGARFVTEHEPDVLGDAFLGGEPSGPNLVRCGEKGFLWLALTVATPGAHGAMPHRSANAIRVLEQLVEQLSEVEELTVQPPEQIRAFMENVAPTVDRELGPGMAALLTRVTLNLGLLSGGLKVNRCLRMRVRKSTFGFRSGWSPARSSIMCAKSWQGNPLHGWRS